jgi:hypothetical protein
MTVSIMARAGTTTNIPLTIMVMITKNPMTTNTMGAAGTTRNTEMGNDQIHTSILTSSLCFFIDSFVIFIQGSFIHIMVINQTVAVLDKKISWSKHFLTAVFCNMIGSS